MTARAEALRFFADESALGLGKSLAIARRDVAHTGHPLIQEVPLGSTDEHWIPTVAARGLVVISRDRRIRTKPAELRAHALRTLWIAGKRDLSNWDTLVRLVHRWDDIERVVADRPTAHGSTPSTTPWFASSASDCAQRRRARDEVDVRPRGVARDSVQVCHLVAMLVLA